MAERRGRMEGLVKGSKLFSDIYENKKVLITGHSGFKGSWMSKWLQSMGATVYGYSLPPHTGNSHWDLIDLKIDEKYDDIRNDVALKAYFQSVKPDIVFHLAAQAIVRDSYKDPVETYSTNVMGTLNVLEACRETESVKAIVVVSSDKCYENREWVWGYRENDPMGGYDPYSSSKGCTELLTSSYRNSYFNIEDFGKTHHLLLASARAGNVIGGGDWANERLIPDIVRASSETKKVQIRDPFATRPWQHVLEPLSGYLCLGWRLLEGNKEFATGWNFGPSAESNLTVGEVVSLAGNHWNQIKAEFAKKRAGAHEANLLMLDCAKANKVLKWKPIWGIDETIGRTIDWYRTYYMENQLNTITDLTGYITEAINKQAIWTK